MKTSSKREALREQYKQGWYQMDADLLVSATSPDFRFEDPAEVEAVTCNMLMDYMWRWDRRAQALGADNRWMLTHELRQDKEQILTDWEWWQVADTGLQGAALVLTSDAGVMLEPICYFERGLQRRWVS